MAGCCPEGPQIAARGLPRRPVCAAPLTTICGPSGHHATYAESAEHPCVSGAPGSAFRGRWMRARTFGEPRLVRQSAVLQIAVAHERVAAKVLGEQRDAPSDARHRLLADFLKAVRAVEQHRDVIAWFEKHFAGQ